MPHMKQEVLLVSYVCVCVWNCWFSFVIGFDVKRDTISLKT